VDFIDVALMESKNFVTSERSAFGTKFLQSLKRAPKGKMRWEACSWREKKRWTRERSNERSELGTKFR